MSGISELVELYRQDESLVDIFGLILFTDEHANIKKVINDEDYWSAFNKLSGKRWVIFSSKQKNGSDGYRALVFCIASRPTWSGRSKSKQIRLGLYL